MSRPSLNQLQLVTFKKKTKLLTHFQRNERQLQGCCQVQAAGKICRMKNLAGFLPSPAVTY